MRTTSYSDLRKNLASELDAVAADHEPVIITRDRGKPAAVLMSLEDFASYEETRYLLRSPVNASWRTARCFGSTPACSSKDRSMRSTTSSGRARRSRNTRSGSVVGAC